MTAQVPSLHLPELVAAYDRQLPVLVHAVIDRLLARPDIPDLIGTNRVRAVYDQQLHLGRFIMNASRFGLDHLLEENLLWFYRVGTSHGYRPDFFPAVWQAWIAAGDRHLPPVAAAAQRQIFTWIDDRHPEFLNRCHAAPYPAADGRHPEAENLTAALLAADDGAALRLTGSLITGPDDISHLYLDVIHPAMDDIGQLWEHGRISVADEHLATAIVSRAIAGIYPVIMSAERTRGTAIVTAAPNELHDLGARMLADLLEIDGWSVDYLGANTPTDDIIAILRKRPANLLVISAAMVANLGLAAEIISTIRSERLFDRLRIMLGGLVLKQEPGLWRRVGADGGFHDARQTVELARQWWRE